MKVTCILCFLGQQHKTWNVTSSSSSWGFECLSVLRQTLVSCCMHCKVCVHLNHGICTDYLYYLCMICCILSQCVTFIHNQSHTIMQEHNTQLRQSSVLKLALFSGSHSAFCWYCQWLKEGCHQTCVYTPYSINSKASTSLVPLADLVKKWTTHKPFPIVGDTPLGTPELVPRPALFFVLQFCVQ